MTALYALACVSTATAQDLIPVKSESVRDRSRPGYEAVGVGLGIFRLYPRLTLGASYDDNVFATETGEIDDLITRIGGNVRLQSQGGRVPMGAHASFDSYSYDDNPREDYTDWEFGGSAGYDLPLRTAARVSADYLRTHEPRGEPSVPTAALERPRYDTGRALLGLTHDFASGRLDFSLGYESIDFDDAKLATGAPLDQDFRDRDTRTFQLQGNLIVGPSTEAFVRVVHTDRDFRIEADAAGVDRDASSVALLGGAAFDYSNLMRGEVGIGVFQLDNRDPNQGNRSSVAINSNVEVYVTQLMTATVNVQRTSAAADIEEASSYIGTSIALRLDYELLRNLILSAAWGRSQRDYSGVSEEDTQNRAGLSAQWLLNRHMRIGFDYSHTERSWAIEQGAQRYTEGVVGATVTFAL